MQQLGKRNYIHTLGCFASLKLCGLSLNNPKGRDSVAGLKTFLNNSDADITCCKTKEVVLC